MTEPRGAQVPAVREEAVPVTLEHVMSTDELVARVRKIREVQDRVMVKGRHYGLIRGTEKPTLYKSGAELLLMTFMIAPGDPKVEKTLTPDSIDYDVRIPALHQQTGVYLGFGIGCASSNEERYRWRAAVNQAEWRETPEDRRRKKYRRGGGTTLQVRTNPADLGNTLIKMAKKRALVDLALTVCAASEVFTQDLEEDDGHARPEADGAPADPLARERLRLQAELRTSLAQAQQRKIEIPENIQKAAKQLVSAADADVERLKQAIAWFRAQKAEKPKEASA